MWVRSIQLLCCSDLEKFEMHGLIENLKKWVAAGYTLAHYGGAYKCLVAAFSSVMDHS